MKKLFIINLLLHSLMLSAQEDTTFYFNKYWNPCNLEEAEYFRIIRQDSVKPDHYHVFDFYASGQMQMQGTYKALHDSINWAVGLEPENCIKNGFNTLYYENGNPMARVLYVNGFLQAGAKWWYENGLVKKTGRYTNDKRSGLWYDYNRQGEITKIRNYFYGELHGNVKHVNEQKITEERKYFDGYRLGTFTFWRRYISSRIKRRLTDMAGKKTDPDSLTPLVVIPKWKNGEKYFVKSSISRKLVRNDSLIYDTENLMDSQIEITGCNENGCDLTYSYLLVKDNSGATVKTFINDPMRDVIDSLKKTPIKIHCDAYGNFDKVTNWEEVKNSFITAIKDVVVKSIGQSSGIFIEREAIKDSIVPEEFYSEENINLIVGNELEYLFHVLDQCFYPGTILNTKTKTSFKHLNIRSEQEVKVHPVNLTDSTFIIENAFEFDGNAITEFINDIYQLPEEVSYFLEDDKKFKRAEMYVKESRTVDLKNNMPDTYGLVISIGDKEMKFQAEVVTKIIAE